MLFNNDLEFDYLYNDRNWLFNQYIIQEKSIGEISRVMDCDTATITNRLKRFDIPIDSTRRKKLIGKMNPACRDEVRAKMRESAKHRNNNKIGKYKRTPEVRKKASEIRINRGLGVGERNGMYGKHHTPETRAMLSSIAKEIMNRPDIKKKVLDGIHRPGVIEKAVKKHKQTCNTPEWKAMHSGPHHPNWRENKTRDYCEKFNDSLKESVRIEFNRTCFLCGVEEKYTPIKEKLHIHHVDYNKSQGCKGLKWSLVPLCRSCHCKTNFHRWYWFAKFRDYWIHSYIDINSISTFNY